MPRSKGEGRPPLAAAGRGRGQPGAGRKRERPRTHPCRSDAARIQHLCSCTPPLRARAREDSVTLRRPVSSARWAAQTGGGAGALPCSLSREACTTQSARYRSVSRQCACRVRGQQMPLLLASIPADGCPCLRPASARPCSQAKDRTRHQARSCAAGRQCFVLSPMVGASLRVCAYSRPPAV